MSAAMKMQTAATETTMTSSGVSHLALIPPALEEMEPVMPAPPAALPIFLPEYGLLEAWGEFEESSLLSGVRCVSFESTTFETQPAPALIRRACATTVPPPSDGSMIWVR